MPPNSYVGVRKGTGGGKMKRKLSRITIPVRPAVMLGLSVKRGGKILLKEK